MSRQRSLRQVDGNESLRAMRHWHPVLLASALKQVPVAVSVLGEPIVLFRTAAGVGAVHDRCPHRGARLSAGHVEDGCIVCPYHLWRFAADGRGASPANPKMKPFARAFDVAEHLGILWLREQGSDAELPSIDHEGLHFVGYDVGQINAPFHVVVDNFTEIEHSPTNHFIFAFDAEGLQAVEPQVDVLSDSLHIVYSGPQRRVPWWTLGAAFGLRAGTRHVIDFKVKFEPIHWVYDLYWEDPKTGERLPQHIREYAFITPRDATSTSVFLLFFTSLGVMSPRSPLRPLLTPFFLHRAHHELMLDTRICENVAQMGGGESVDRFQLGKFDRVLKHTRHFINAIYHGPAEHERARQSTQTAE